MNRMHKALENLKLEGQKASRVQQSRRAVSPRVAAAIRSKFASSMALEIPSSPSVLFSAPLLAGHENDRLSVHESPSLPVEVSQREDAPQPEKLATSSIAILGDDIAPTPSATHSPEDRSNAVFASLARETAPTILPEAVPSGDAVGASLVAPVDAPVITPANMLLNAIVLKRPTRTFRLDRQTDRLAIDETPSDSIPFETPKGAVAIPATEWELESSRELADPIRYGQYAELLRSIRRDVRATKSPVIAYCSIEADAQTPDMIHRVAVIASRGGTAKVLVVDAHQAMPRITGELNLPDQVGILDALSREVPADAVVRPTSQAGVFVVPLGNGAIDHLGNTRRRLASLVQGWKQEYSLVLVDVGAMSGALASLICAGCDGTYVAVQLGATLAVEAERRIKQFRTDGVNLLGCVALQPQ